MTSQPAWDPEELNGLLRAIKSDNETDAQNAILRLVTHWRDVPSGMKRIIDEIETDQVDETNDIKKLAHSKNWNTLALTYLYRGDRSSALETGAAASILETSGPFIWVEQDLGSATSQAGHHLFLSLVRCRM